MLQTLFHIPATIAGYPTFGFGLLLLVWCLFAAVFMGILIWRHGVNADALGYLPILLLVAAAIVWLLPAVCDKQGQGLPIRGYGVMMLAAVVVGTGLAVWRGKRRGLAPDAIFSLAIWMFLPGIIGGRLFYVIEYWDTYRRETFGQMLAAVANIAEGGLVVYGAFVGGTLGMILFVRKHRLPLLAFCDLVSPSLVLGLAIGRIGCFLSGCCYGGACDLPWAVTFPKTSSVYESQMSRGQMHGFLLSGRFDAPSVVLEVEQNSAAAQAGLKAGDRVIGVDGMPIKNNGQLMQAILGGLTAQVPVTLDLPGQREVTLPAIALPPRSLPVHPTQLYSSINALLLCLFLLSVEPFARRDGTVFALMLTIYPINRFLLEIIRTDEADVFGTGMSISQNVSLLVLASVAVVWCFVLRGPAKKASF